MILDWDVAQIEGALLETWLPTVFRRLEELAQQCRARLGSLGAMIEDKNSGTILLQQALRRGLQAQAIDSKLTAMGKDERALSVSGYVYRGQVSTPITHSTKLAPINEEPRTTWPIRSKAFGWAIRTVSGMTF
jgi:hypothetical protein